MLIGLGDLGSVVLELLAREEGLGRIVVGSRNVERSTARCNLARLGAIAQGHAPRISFVPLDLDQREAVAETVHREAPDVIVSTATMLTWWLPSLLPPEPRARINSAGFGVWLPVHLTLTLKLMQALHDVDYDGVTLTAPFPDVVNPILGCLGLAPTCGLGNIAQFVPKVRYLAAERLDAPLEAVRVLMVAHHALGPAVVRSKTDPLPPYFLRIEHGGKDVTKEVGGDELLVAPYRRTAGRASHFLTAGATVRLIRALLSGRDTLLHEPAPNGLPGGYPVIAGNGRVQPASIDGLSLEEAIDINERSHRFDGIERIEPDGTAVFCPEPAGVLHAELGYDCTRLPPEESEGRAQELIAKFQKYAHTHSVDLLSLST